MKVLIIGNGGREHALAWKIAQSESVSQIYVAPGNAGTQAEAKTTNVDINILAFEQLINFVKHNAIELTIVGPEAPLAAGIVDQFQAEGLTCFGPSQYAAQLESSKLFCKTFLQKNNIPTANYHKFNDKSLANSYVQNQVFPIVIKADGLAAGKGVIIAYSIKEAEHAIHQLLKNENQTIIIEDFLEGEEASFIVISDGTHCLPLATSQDHKARDDGDCGPNTGGMGAYSPAPIVTSAMHQRIMNTIIKPTIQALADNGTPYVGFLYAGLMINPHGDIKVLEYNCRFGDPETQPILMRLTSDLASICIHALNHTLDQINITWDPRPALGVVLAAKGYPEQYEKGFAITGLDKTQKACKIFHAGTCLKNDQVFTNGGRVLCVTALGEDISHAQQLAYQQVKHIQWPGVFYRHDIGYRAIAKHTIQTGDTA